MRLLVVMQSSTEPVYQETTQVLKDAYRRIIEQKNLPVDVISYVGNAEETHLEGDTLYIKCDNKLSVDKHRELYRYIVEHPEYDWVLKTNVSTVANLELICKLMERNYIWSTNLYCASIMWDARCSGTIDYRGTSMVYSNFPIGFFHLAHHDLWKDIYEAYDEVVYPVLENCRKQEPDYEPNDDVLMGPLLIATGHNVVEVFNGIKLPTDELENFSLMINDVDHIFSSMCIRCKLVVEDTYKVKGNPVSTLRAIYEPRIIRLFAKIYEGHNTTEEDIMHCATNIGYRYL